MSALTADYEIEPKENQKVIEENSDDVTKALKDVHHIPANTAREGYKILEGSNLNIDQIKALLEIADNLYTGKMDKNLAKTILAGILMSEDKAESLVSHVRFFNTYKGWSKQPKPIN